MATYRNILWYRLNATAGNHVEIQFSLILMLIFITTNGTTIQSEISWWYYFTTGPNVVQTTGNLIENYVQHEIGLVNVLHS